MYEIIGNIIVGVMLLAIIYGIFVKLSGWNPIYDFIKKIADIWRYGP